MVNDIVYTPLETPLLRAAAKRGNPVVDGLGMLLYQAQPGFAAWFGVEPEVTPGLRSWMLKGLQVQLHPHSGLDPSSIAENTGFDWVILPPYS